MLWESRFENHQSTGFMLLSSVSGDIYMPVVLGIPASVPLKGEGVGLWHFYIPNMALWPWHQSSPAITSSAPLDSRSRGHWDLFDSVTLPSGGKPR